MAKEDQSASDTNKSSMTKALGEKALEKLRKKGLGGKKKKEQKDKDQQSPDKFRAAVLFIVMLLFLLLVFVEGSSGWRWLHNVIRGIFGVTVLLVPTLIGMAAWRADSEKESSIRLTFGWSTFLVIIVAGAIQILFNGNTQETNIFSYIKYLYQDGVENTFGSGGLLSFLLAYPLFTFLGTIGARIVIILLLLTILFWVSKKSPRDLLMLVTRPFQRDETDEKKAMEEQPDVPMDYVHGDQPVKSTRPPLYKRLGNFLLMKDEEEMEPAEMPAQQEPIPEPMNASYPPQPEPAYVPEEETYPPEIEYEAENLYDMPEDGTAFSDEMQMPPDAEDPALSAVIHDTAEPDSIRQSFGIANGNVKTPYGLPVAEDEQAPVQTAPAEPVKPKESYHIPPLSFLKNGTSHANDAKTREELSEKATILINTLKSFGVEVRITGIYPGPAVTRYEVQPAAGVKVSKITGLADDIALNLAASGVRIEAPIPGKPAIGIEVPNSNKDTVALRDILESEAFRSSKSKLTFAVGKDIAGNAIVGDVAKMPHMIIAGATGSGKSVCTNSIIMSILMNASPDEVKMILIDPKIVEFRVYEGIPHLLIPVVTDPKKAAGALNWAVQEMLRRYRQFAEQNVRDIYDYNEKAALPGSELERMSQIVIAIDELADLMMAASKEVEDAICRLAQMARAAGMHLIIATQRPTTDIITGLIKANIPSRIALSVMSQIDSRTILDIGGAEKLLGHGDMLYLPNGLPKPIRVQGCFTSTAEIERVVEFIKNQTQTTYDHEIMEEVEQNIPVTKADKAAQQAESDAASDEDLIERAMEVVVQMGQASTSSLQRRLKLGYARAARIMDELEKMGVIGPYEGAKPRRVLLTPQQLAERKVRNLK